MTTYTSPVWAFITKSSMQHLKAVQNWVLRLIGGYDRYTRIDKMHLELEMIKPKSFMKHLTLKLYVYARNIRSKYIKRLGTDTLDDNRRVSKPVHILVQ